MLLTLLTTKSCNCFWRASVHIDRCLPVVYINQRRNSLTRSRAFNSSPSVRLQPDSVEQFILQHFRWQSLCGLELMAIALQHHTHIHTYTHSMYVHGHVQYPQPCKQKFSKTSHRSESNKFNLSGLARSLSQCVANPFTISK